MRALKRDTEIWVESNWTKWVYEHLDWLTAPRPNGDGYTLIDNYEPPEDKYEPPEGYYDEMQ